MNISTRRVEFFSDGVISIAITMLAFEMKLPGFKELTKISQWTLVIAMFPTGFIYLLSFALLAIVWAGHHELFLKVKHTDAALLWLNMGLLFWLTLLPVAAYMMGKYPSLPLPIAGYGFNMVMLSVCFILCRRHILDHHMLASKSPNLNSAAYKMAQNKHLRSYIGLTVYALSVFFAFISIPLAYVCLALPSLLYIIPGNVNNEKMANLFAGVLPRRRLQHH